MRVGTWNLAGRWTSNHESFLHGLGCDVLLLTEVSEHLVLPGYEMHLSDTEMACRRRWAGVLSLSSLTPEPDPHPASAMAIVNDWTFCSSILPWRSCGNREPWIGSRHADKTQATVETLLGSFPGTGLIWGGDWNHALLGREYAGSIGGRRRISSAVDKLGLQVPTADLPHRIDGLLTIDHIAVPSDARVLSAERHVAAVADRRLSDHDAYAVTLA